MLIGAKLTERTPLRSGGYAVGGGGTSVADGFQFASKDSERYAPAFPSKLREDKIVPDSAEKPRTRVERGDYMAEVLQGNNATEQFWYYVLQRKGSPEILHIEKYKIFEEAVEGANQALQRMRRATAAD